MKIIIETDFSDPLFKILTTIAKVQNAINNISSNKGLELDDAFDKVLNS